MTDQDIEAVEERTKADLHYMPHECLFGMAIHQWTVTISQSYEVSPPIVRIVAFKKNREGLVVKGDIVDAKGMILLLNSLLHQAMQADHGRCD